MRDDTRTRLFRMTVVGGALALLAMPVPGAQRPGGDWPQYRGPARDGISAQTGLLREWPAGGPKVLWKVPLGEGYSGISVSDGRLYTMFSKEGAEYVGCFDPATGKEIWKTRTDANRSDEMGDGPRSTPTVDDRMVYALGANGMLIAVKSAGGEKVWQKDLKAEFGARVPHWGVASSPLVEGDLLIMDAGGPGKSVVALDKRTGETRWTAHDDRPGYSAPLAVTIHGVRQVLSFAGTSLVSVAPGDGRVLWSVPWKTSYDVNAAMPVFIPPDKVFISSGYDVGAAVYQVTKDGGGKLEVAEVWKSRIMKNHFNSSIHYGGHIYGFDDATLKCIDAQTGEERWRQRGFNKGSLLLADGHLIVFGEAGQLALVEATPEAYREKAKAQILEGRTWTMPALAGGRLYLRNQKEMVALEVAG